MVIYLLSSRKLIKHSSNVRFLQYGDCGGASIGMRKKSLVFLSSLTGHPRKPPSKRSSLILVTFVEPNYRGLHIFIAINFSILGMWT